jgi:hypothetical protein
MNFVDNKIDRMMNVFNNLIGFSKNLEKEFNNIYYIKKIREKTKNKEVSKILNKYLDKFLMNVINCEKLFVKYSKDIEQIYLEYYKMDKMNIENINNRIILPLSKIIMEIREYLDYQIDIPMDCYFLRRFLDKDYITNGVIYCGMAHSADIVNILLNDFNFKITHNTGIINIDELNKKIRTKKYSEQDIHNLLIANDKYMYQCSDLTKFPTYFE